MNTSFEALLSIQLDLGTGKNWTVAFELQVNMEVHWWNFLEQFASTQKIILCVTLCSTPTSFRWNQKDQCVQGLQVICWPLAMSFALPVESVRTIHLECNLNAKMHWIRKMRCHLSRSQISFLLVCERRWWTAYDWALSSWHRFPQMQQTYIDVFSLQPPFPLLGRQKNVCLVETDCLKVERRSGTARRVAAWPWYGRILGYAMVDNRSGWQLNRTKSFLNLCTTPQCHSWQRSPRYAFNLGGI